MKITDQRLASREHATRRGTVEYRIDNVEFPLGIWGREHFTLTRHQNGDRVLRAFCELDDELPDAQIAVADEIGHAALLVEYQGQNVVRDDGDSVAFGLVRERLLKPLDAHVESLRLCEERV